MDDNRVEFWRVETCRGVETIRVWPSRVHQHDTWNASHPRYGTVDIRRSPHDAAQGLVYVAQVHAPVLAPGAPTRDELTAKLRAVEAERDALKEDVDRWQRSSAEHHRLCVEAQKSADFWRETEGRTQARCVALGDDARRAHARCDILVANLQSAEATAVSVRAERDGALAQCETLTQALREAQRERDALMPIGEWRTAPPTDADLAVHAARGGLWRTRYTLGDPALSGDGMDADRAERVRDEQVRTGGVYLWWALDSHGRPCAWPGDVP